MKKSSVSLTYRKSDPQQILNPLNNKNTQIQTLINQLQEQLRMIKKQLKCKVNRSQFISQLNSKLSISELATINFKSSDKQNINKYDDNKGNNANNGYRHMYDKLEKCVVDFDRKVSSMSNKQILQQIDSIKEQILDVINKYKRQQTKLQNMTQKIQQQQSQYKQRLNQVQAYIYRKADRSQLQKLFTLNQLLVIQIQQAKKKVQQYQKQKTKQLCQLETKLSTALTQKQQNKKLHDNKMLQLQKKISIYQSHTSHQLNKMLNIIQNTHKCYQNTAISIKQLSDRLYLYQNQSQNTIIRDNSNIKQIILRLNVLQLKDNQINRSIRDVDNVRNQIQQIKLDIGQLYDRGKQVGVHIRRFCQDLVYNNSNQVQQKVVKNMQHLCQDIMKKVIQLNNDLLSHQEIDNIILPIKQKQKQILLNIGQHNENITVLTQNYQKLQQSLQEQIQSNQQRIATLQNNMNNLYVPFNKFYQIITKFVQVQEFKQVGKQIDKKINVQLKKIVDDQDKINQVICAENIMAKWFWGQSGLKGGNLIAWDKMIVNTLPENFKWIKGQPLVVISKGGYYRIQLGFYSKKKPSVQLIVNGQTIVSAVNTSSYVVHHSSGKLKDVSNSEIAGLTYIDFLLLPDDARIAISYIGDFTGEGFFFIQRV